MKAELLPEMTGQTIVCIQAGNVNTGAFDHADQICDRAHKKNAWVHVDGAFGLWASASPERRYLARGLEKADSWATDAHKWLNVPYDSGIAVKDSNP
jgi:glutamate/tyrosine decarboxylase-like PLP-dependent enzyme